MSEFFFPEVTNRNYLLIRQHDGIHDEIQAKIPWQTQILNPFDFSGTLVKSHDWVHLGWFVKMPSLEIVLEATDSNARLPLISKKE